MVPPEGGVPSARLRRNEPQEWFTACVQANVKEGGPSDQAALPMLASSSPFHPEVKHPQRSS